LPHIHKPENKLGGAFEMGQNSNQASLWHLLWMDFHSYGDQYDDTIREHRVEKVWPIGIILDNHYTHWYTYHCYNSNTEEQGLGILSYNHMGILWDFGEAHFNKLPGRAISGDNNNHHY
jgi:hypothetical protein